MRIRSSSSDRKKLRRARDRPGGRSGRAAGCRCAGSRGARCRARRARRPRAPPRCAAAISARISLDRRRRARASSVDRRRVSSSSAHLEIAAELDVGAAAGHVGGDGHRARHAGLGDDVGLLLVVAGVQHLVRDACCFLSSVATASRTSRSTDRADQHRLLRARGTPRSARRSPSYFSRRGAVDLVVVVVADAPARWSGSRSRRACRSRRTRPPRSSPCRSCRRASGRGGNSSGR